MLEYLENTVYPTNLVFCGLKSNEELKMKN